MAREKHTQKSKLRWFQIRLRTLVLAFTTVTVVLAAFGFFVRPYLLQRDVIQAIKNAGGVVETRPGPSWLKAILGEENCQEITLVNLADIDPSRELLFGIKQLPALEVLVLGGTALEDDDLRFVPKCESLEGVILDSTLISDEAIANLRAARPALHVIRCDRRSISIWETRGMSGTVKRESCAMPPDAQLASRLPADYFVEAVAIGVGDSFSRFTPAAEQIAALDTFHRIRKLRIHAKDLTAADVAAIARRTSLESLELVFDSYFLNGPSILDSSFRSADPWWSDLSALANLRNLKSLSLRGLPVDDQSLQQLSALTRLDRLDLAYTCVQEPGVWPSFPLKELVLDDTFIEDVDLPAIARYVNIEQLSLNFTEITDGGLPALLPLGELSALDLAGTRITNGGYDVLCQFPQLEQVTLGSIPDRFERNSLPGTQPIVGVNGPPRTWLTPFVPKWNAKFHHKNEIPRIAFDREAFAPSSVSFATLFGVPLPYCPPDPDVDKLRLHALSGETSARWYLDLSEGFTCDDDLKYLSALPELEVLSLKDTWVTDAGLSHLTNCPQLRILLLTGTAITDRGIEQLSKLKSLEVLALPAQTVRGPGFRQLAELPKLRVVYLGKPWLRTGRARCAPDLTVSDVEQFAKLAQQLIRRFDADGDRIINEDEFFKYWDAPDSVNLDGLTNDEFAIPGVGDSLRSALNRFGEIQRLTRDARANLLELSPR